MDQLSNKLEALMGLKQRIIGAWILMGIVGPVVGSIVGGYILYHLTKGGP